MSSLSTTIPELEDTLADRYGRSPRSGAIGTFEGVVAAFLRRSGEARVVPRAVDALRDSGLSDPSALAGADPSEIEDLWRSTGARGLLKAIRPLTRLAHWVADSALFEDEGRPETTAPVEALRESLRGLNGIGAATADALLLEGFGLPAYPVDRATYRILVRHGWLDPGADYDEARSIVESAVGADPDRLAQFSGWFDRVGRDACRVSVAKCDRCPLRPFLPEGGPYEAS